MKNVLFLVLVALLCVWKMNAQGPVKRILLEEFSTAPCGFCPDGDVIAEKLVADHPQVIWVTHHAGFGTDSMTVAESKAIASAFTDFAPGACIDRGDHPIPVYTRPPFIAVSRQKWDSVCTAHLGDAPVTAITLQNTLNRSARSISCTVVIQFVSAPAPGDLRLNLYIVEDSVSGVGKGYDQTNYFNGTPGHPYYKKGDPIVGYSHKRVLRAVPSGAWGLTGVFPSAPGTGTYTYTFQNIPLAAAWNIEALDVVAFVSYYDADAKKRAVINSASRRATDGPSAISEAGITEHQTRLDVYPTPVRVGSIATIALDGSGQGELLLSDLYGREVGRWQVAAGMTSMPLPPLPSGAYMCRFVSGNLVHAESRLLVVR
ncbi:MAG: Omp28-related outer membrane protein [Ignavibacteriae bacterium]|nr:Omp28-related outer membrane protein [Ignavibacteriota bacterium]